MSGLKKQNKGKRYKQLNYDWTKIYFWLKAVENDVYQAYCILCNKFFSIKYTTISNVKRHATSETHISKQKCLEVNPQRKLVIDGSRSLNFSEGEF